MRGGLTGCVPATRIRVWAVIACLGTLLCTVPVAAHANLIHAEPGIGATVDRAPASLRLTFSEAPEPRYTQVQVLDTAKTRFDRGGVQVAPADPQTLTVPLASLSDGVYTVIWQTVSAVDGHDTAGSFAFIVGTGTLMGTTAPAQTVAFSPPSTGDVVGKWAGYLAASVLVGALALWFLVWLPALGAISDRATRTRLVAVMGQRLLTLAAVAATLLLVATLAGTTGQLVKGTRQSLAASLTLATLSDFLLTTRAGSIWLVRLALALLALAVILPSAVRTLRGRAPTAALLVLPAYGGIVIGANTLLATSFLSHAAATSLAPVLAVVMDWLHLLATSLWIGGLAGLVATVPLVIADPPGRAVLRAAVGRFSDLALISVGVLTLTGLYAAWLHIASPTDLLTTDYGRALTLKLVLFGALIALGGVNLLWLRPRLARGDDSAGMSHRFTSVIAVEVVTGIAVLVVAATLTSLAPSREVRAATVSPLAQTVVADDLAITLTPSTLAPGPITYDASVSQKGTPLTDAVRVTFRFAARDLGVDETEAVAENGGGGHYRVTGPYTALPGTWQVRAIVRRTARDDASATFVLPIGGSLPPLSTSSATPQVTRAAVVSGGAAMLVVVVTLVTATVMSRRRGASRRQQAVMGAISTR